MSLGFLFLAFDEFLSIHEQMDRWIHWIFNMEETGLSDRIDDFIILLYGVAGVIIIYFHRSEFSNLGALYKYLTLGFALLLIMVLLDAFGNRDDYIAYIGVEESLRSGIMKAVSFTEELTKLLSQIVFLLGFLRVFKQFYDQGQTATRAK